MTEKRIDKCLVDNVVVNDRLRQLDKNKISELAASMSAIGLQQPITVWSPDDDTCELVAGLHRLKAAKRLGWKEIECVYANLNDIDRQLWEIDENLIRAELTVLERGDHHARRKEILEAQGTVQKHGGDRRSSRQDADLKSYASAGAEKFGVHADTIRRDIRRAERIAPDVKEKINQMPFGRDIADSGAELDALANLDHDEQRQAIAHVRSGKAGTARSAIHQLKQLNEEPDISIEKFTEKLAINLGRILCDVSDKPRVDKIKAIAKNQDSLEFTESEEMQLALDGVAKTRNGLSHTV